MSGSATIARRAEAWFTGLKPAGIVGFMIIVGGLARMIVSASIGLELDGSYSVVIARQLSWSYFDHPPMHQWLVWAAAQVFNSEAGAVVRLPFILLFAGSTWLMYRLTSRVFGEWAGVWAAASLNLCGAFTFFYGLFIVPDGPLFFFLLLAADLLAKLIFVGEPPRHPLPIWLAAGAAGGAAMLSKYSAIFFFIGAFLFLLTVPRQRKRLATAGPWLGVVLGAILFMPVIIWNAQHEWISFTFQGARAMNGQHAGIGEVAGSIIAQFGYLTPWFFIPMAYVYGRAAFAGPADAGRWYFVCLTSGPIVVFTLLNLMQRGLPHWTMPGWLFVFPLLGHWFAGLRENWRRIVGWLGAIGAAASLVGAVVAIALIRTGLLAGMFAIVLPDSKFPNRDPTLEVMDWHGIRAELESRGDLSGNVRFVASTVSSNTGKLGYGFGAEYPVLCLCGDARGDFSYANHFRYVNNYAAFAGADGIVIMQGTNVPPDKWLEARFARIERLPDVRLVRHGRPAGQFTILRGTGFIPPGN
jgi:hypothetical protein